MRLINRTLRGIAIIITLTGIIVAVVCLTQPRNTIVPPVASQTQVDTLQEAFDRYLVSNYKAHVEITNYQKWVDKWIDAQENRLSVKVDVPTIENAVPKVIPGVVHVMCPQWQGSGFVVGPRLIATARHVVEGVTDFTITTYNGHRLRATRAISFKNRDVGFIWIDDLRCVSEVDRELECSKVKHEVTLQILELGSIKECNLGQPVFAIGSPYGKVNFNHLSSGIISALDRSWDELGEDYGWEVGWITTVSGHPGNSGCPVFTLDGRVRGILVGGFSPVLIIAMPVDLFKDRLDEVALTFGMDQFQKEKPIPPIAKDWSYTSKGN